MPVGELQEPALPAPGGLREPQAEGISGGLRVFPETGQLASRRQDTEGSRGQRG